MLHYFMGIIVGAFVMWLINRRTMGTIRVDRSDPDGPYLFLELNRSIETVINSKYIRFKVDATDISSRK